MFLVLGLPRSRTFWLSKFLSYREFECGHEEARYLRSVEDAKIWLNQEYRGSAETYVAPFWRLIRDINPNLKIIIVRRPVADVVKSLLALDMSGVCQFSEADLTKQMKKLDAKLAQIERRIPSVLSVKYDDIDSEQIARDIFEHCLPHAFDKEWWASLRDKNLQCSMRALTRYTMAYQRPLERMVKTAIHLSRAKLLAKPPLSTDGVTIQQETVDAWERDGVPLFEAHCVEVGESPDNWKNKNIPLIKKLYNAGCLQITTARCNGRMFGYLAALIHPSLESKTLLSAVHTTFYVSKDMPGLALKLQRASVAALRKNGAGEIFFHEGVRGDGPRMGTLYKRMGAKEFGRFYRMEFEGV